MVRLELDQLVMRRMKEDDIEMVKQLIKEGCEGTENRLVLHILTRPLCLFLLAVCSSVLRCLIHSFILALAVPVFLLIIFLKISMPRSSGVLGSSRPSWDYVGSSFRGNQDQVLENPFGQTKTSVSKKARPKVRPEESTTEPAPEKISLEREQAAGQVWVAVCDGEVLACLFREGERRAGERRICRLVVGSWYRREGLGRLLVQSLAQKERRDGAHRLTAHVPFPSQLGQVVFKKLGFHESAGEPGLETPERGFLGYPLTRVFYKDL